MGQEILDKNLESEDIEIQTTFNEDDIEQLYDEETIVENIYKEGEE